MRLTASADMRGNLRVCPRFLRVCPRFLSPFSTIEITMDDTMRYTPSEINVNTGETVRFFIKNLGKMPHELVLGSMD